MNQITLEITIALLAAVLAPLFTIVTTLGFLFSKTYIQTFIRNPFEFTTQTVKQYSLFLIQIYSPLTLLWGGSLAILTATFAVDSLSTQAITAPIVAGILFTAVAYGILMTKYPVKIRQFFSNETEFYTRTLDQKIILYGLIWTQLIMLVLVFFSLLVLFTITLP